MQPGAMRQQKRCPCRVNVCVTGQSSSDSTSRCTALQEQIAEAERQKAAAIAAEDYVKVLLTHRGLTFVMPCTVLSAPVGSRRPLRLAIKAASARSSGFACLLACLFVCLFCAGGRG